MSATHDPSLVEALGSHELSRRELLKASGALIVGFSLFGQSIVKPQTAAAQFDAVVSPDLLDSWIAIDAQGNITLFTGKVELGTGVQTALAQIAAEELDVAFDRMSVVQGDTALTVDQGATVASRSISSGGPQVRQAAADARLALLRMASARLGVPVAELRVQDGLITASSDPLKQVSYGELVGGGKFESALTKEATPKSPSEYSIVGRPIQRMDIPDKVTGGPIFVQDIRLPGMLHARTIKPPAVGSMLEGVDEDSIRDLPGVVKVVVKGNFVAVVAEREEQAIEAAQRLKVTWSGWSGLPTKDELYQLLRTTESVENVVRARDFRFDRIVAEDGPGHLPVPVPDPRIDRPIVRGGRRSRRWGNALVPGRQCARAAELHRRAPRPAGRERAHHLEGRGRLLRKERSRRRHRRRGHDLPGGWGPGPPAVDAARRAPLGERRAGHGDGPPGRARRARPGHGVGLPGLHAEPLLCRSAH